MSKFHNLKCWPEYFREFKSGKKTFELRRDDRAFELGDYLVLMEFDPDLQKYTREAFAVRVTHIARGLLVPDGFCAMSVEPAENTPDRARRIRELVREWVGAVETSEALNALPAFYPHDVKKLVEQAADTIDALDDAEIG